MLLSVPQSSSPILDSAAISTIADMATIVGAVSVIIAVISVIIAYQGYKKEHKRKSIENSVNLARTYEKEIIYPLYSITNIFQSSNINIFIGQKLDVRNRKELKFTFQELIDISQDAQIEKTFIEAFIKIGPEAIEKYKDVVSKKTQSINFNLTIGPIPKEYIKNDEADNKGQPHRLTQTQVDILNELLSDITKLLNSLEWFAMNFHTNIADEAIIYQSLHQSFISCVQYLYYFIAFRNKNTYDKFYINIEWLYNKWNQRLMEAAENEVERKKEIFEAHKRNTEKIEKEIVHVPSKLK